MRIVRRKEFLALPPGTIYQSLGAPNSWVIDGNLEVKLQNCGYNDWFLATLVGGGVINHPTEPDCFNAGMEAMERGESLPVTISHSRDGCFGPDLDRFLIWEPEDVKVLIAALTNPPKEY